MSDRAPSGRTDSYPDDIIAKLKWLAKFAKSEKVDATVWAGDIFHHKQPSRTSHSTVLKMIDVVQSFDNLYIVTGNHDISNDVLESVHEKQPLGVLLQSGAKELDGWHETLPIYGVPWQQRWLHEGVVQGAFEGWRSANEGNDYGNSNDRSLAVTHAPIYPPGEAENQMFDLLPTMGEDGLSAAMDHMGYLYYGHIHEDHGIFEVEGVTYCNPGAISRGSLHEYNLSRKIQAAVWSDGEDSKYELGFTLIPIPHKPAEEVFRIAAAQESKAEKVSLDTFLTEVGTQSLSISSTEDVIEHIKSLEQITPRVKKTAIEILEEIG